MKKSAMLALGALAMIPGQAFASDWIVGGKVTSIEVSYAPAGPLPFRIDAAGGSCPAGTTLTWNLQGADATARAQNYQAILATLMTAKSTGQSITIYGNNANCTVDFLYLT